ncbi:glycoside hydrolase family 97 N-terminal domain-containing protein [Pedobacter sp. NJ-S-72]
MNKYSFLLFISVLCPALLSAQNIISPDKKIRVELVITSGRPVYSIYVNNQSVLQKSAMGVDINGFSFHDGIKIASVSPLSLIEDHYSTLNAKKSQIIYKANKRTFTLLGSQKQKIGITFQVSNDGVAFRYEFTGKHKIS